MNTGLESLPLLQSLGIFLLPIIFVLLAWTLVLKGFALWKAARNGHKVWFLGMLIVNLLGIPEIIYLLWFSKPVSPTTSAPAPAPEDI